VNKGIPEQCVDAVSDRKRGKKSNNDPNKKLKPIDRQTNSILESVVAQQESSNISSPTTSPTEPYGLTFNDTLQPTDITAGNEDLPPELRTLFDELFGTDPDEAQAFHRAMEKAKRKLLVAFSEQEADEVIQFSILNLYYRVCSLISNPLKKTCKTDRT
jgi:hypothetical protein